MTLTSFLMPTLSCRHHKHIGESPPQPADNYSSFAPVIDDHAGFARLPTVRLHEGPLADEVWLDPRVRRMSTA